MRLNQSSGRVRLRVKLPPETNFTERMEDATNIAQGERVWNEVSVELGGLLIRYGARQLCGRYHCASWVTRDKWNAAIERAREISGSKAARKLAAAIEDMWGMHSHWERLKEE